MQYRFGTLLLLAALLGGTSSAMAQTADEARAIAEKIKAMAAAPASPNGQPMEAVWDRAPDAPDAGADARPYFVSRWGGIVIRGRPNGGLVDRALTARHCGASDNPATDIIFIGEAPPNICEGVTVVAANKTISLESPVTIKGHESQYVKLGTPSGWFVLEFLQKIDGVTHSGLPPASGDAASEWGTSSLGAFYRNEDGKHIFYAPGETVKLVEDYSFVVEPIMDVDEISAKAGAAVMDKIANNMPTDPTLASIGQPKPKTPWDWAFLLVFGLPLAIIAGLIFRIRRFRRRRAIAVPATGGLPPTMVVEPADIPIGMNYADTVAKAGPASGATPTDGRPRQPAGQPPDHLQAWRALPPGQRKSIIGGAVVLALFALFVILRPTNFGGATETETLRRAVTDGAWALHEESLDGQPQKPDEDARITSPAWNHLTRFTSDRPGRVKDFLDTFVAPTDATNALDGMHDGKPAQQLLIPPDSGTATPFAEPMAMPGIPARDFECRRTAAYLSCMTQVPQTTILLSVRVPITGYSDPSGADPYKAQVVAEAQGAITQLKDLGIGGEQTGGDKK